MTIQWHGLNHIKVVGKNTTIVFDPVTKETGLRVPKVVGDITCFSSKIYAHDVKNSYIIDSPGEYEVSGTFIFGFSSSGPEESENIIYMTEVDDLYVTHLGNLTGEISPNVLEKLRKTNILCVPVGNKDTLNAKQARDVIAAIEPAMVIPIHYKTKGLKAELDDLETFAKEIGIKVEEQEEKLKVSKKDLMTEKTQFVILSA